MCGIAGIVGIAPERARPAVERMRAAAAHRGPDDAGVEVVHGPDGAPPVVLAHTRLSIVDLSAAGHQPMYDEPPPGGARNVLTFNGEIYNFRELQRELARAGFPCVTGSDSEVLLKGYRAWGPRAVERFEGMFAFCLLDPARGLVWLARDRIGMKPLYLYGSGSGGLLFASELRMLLAAGSDLVPGRLDRRALESFFAQGAVVSGHSIVQGVRLLGPGESLVCDFEGRPLHSTRYWRAAFGTATGQVLHPASVEDAAPAAAQTQRGMRQALVEELGADLRRALRGTLLADVPVGLFLSSGIDSTALVTLASEVSTEPLRTISVGFDVPTFDETAEAARTAALLGTRHREIRLSGESVLSSFDGVLLAMDQPTVDGFNTYFTARAAHESGLKVALSGLGGDELFGGYATFRDLPRALRLKEATARLNPRIRRGLAGAAARLATLPRLEGRGRALAKLGDVLDGGNDLVQLYLLRRELMNVRRRRALQPLPDGSDPRSGVELEELDVLARETAAADTLDRVAALEFSMYMRHMLLRDSDVFSMVHGLELRLPLLEHYVVATAAKARSEWRRADPRPKPLLLDAVGRGMPASVAAAKKRGFTFPWRAWLAGPLGERAAAALASPSLRDAGLAPRAVGELGRSFRGGDPSVNALEVLALVVLEGYLTRHRLSA